MKKLARMHTGATLVYAATDAAYFPSASLSADFPLPPIALSLSLFVSSATRLKSLHLFTYLPLFVFASPRLSCCCGRGIAYCCTGKGRRRREGTVEKRVCVCVWEERGGGEETLKG